MISYFALVHEGTLKVKNETKNGKMQITEHKVAVTLHEQA